MGFFVFSWAIMLVGYAVHVAIDRSATRHTTGRLIELAALWLVVVGGGVFAIWGGIYHLGPTSTSIANEIGYRPSMFQWEVGWADVAIGVLCILCARRSLRGQWMSAAIAVLSVSYFGDGIGHIMQYVAHGNHAADNVWAMPSDFALPLLAALFTLLARRGAPRPVVAVPMSRQPVAQGAD